MLGCAKGKFVRIRQAYNAYHTEYAPLPSDQWILNDFTDNSIYVFSFGGHKNIKKNYDLLLFAVVRDRGGGIKYIVLLVYFTQNCIYCG